ncbi:MAG: GNAT family N-acetyltransferase [Clostridia bacterium]|nr:GNAT family N-acetyltransferase [Clostridia bacterium]
MKMQLKRISTKNEYQAIEKIYTQSFPDNERAPMKLLKKRANRGKADFLAAYDGENLVGMAYVVCHNDLAYLFYIAVDAKERGRGFGTKMLSALLERYRGRRFFFALEQLDESADNYEQRVKRHEFYKSCGLRDLPFKLKEGTVTFAAMGKRISERSQSEADDDFTVLPEEYKELMNRYMGFIMKHLVDVRLLP